MDVQKNVETGVDRFLFAVNHRATSRQDCSNIQGLGTNLFKCFIKTVCVTEGISTSGSETWVATHGLRVTLASLLFAAGH